MNKDFKLNAVDPAIEIPQEKFNTDFAIVCSALVKDTRQSVNAFFQQIISEITQLPDDCLLFILPEYCFRNAEPQMVMELIHNELIPEMPKKLTIVLGSLEFTLNNKYTNNAIIIHDQNLWFRPKTKILAGEKRNGLEAGYNSGVIKLPYFNLGVLICADLWDNSLVKKLVKQQADILAIPAWTSTRDGKTALSDWSALVRTESTGKSKIIAVCDHFSAPPDGTLEVAGATQIRSPSDRGFVASLKPVFKSVAFVNLNRVNQSREDWASKGLAQSYFFKPADTNSNQTELPKPIFNEL